MSSPPRSAVAGILCLDPALDARARALAQRLALSLLGETTPEPHLLFDAEGLSLVPGTGIGAIRVDFLGGSVGHRHRHGGGRGQAIAKAVGLKGGLNPSVIDATAGLGKDAFVLASLGCRVRMIERAPVIAALLADGLARARSDADTGSWLDQRLHLHPGDATGLLPRLCAQEPADVIYLDPMYPERKKSALVKKEMRVFRQLLGDDADADRLLETALGLARRRVVVKRPRLGEALAGPAPGLVIEGKTTRYDIYLTFRESH